MLPFILVLASIFIFPLLGALSNKFRKEKRQLLVTVFEVLMFALAVYLFVYLFNIQEFFLLFLALVIYIESRIGSVLNYKEGE